MKKLFNLHPGLATAIALVCAQITSTQMANAGCNFCDPVTSCITANFNGTPVAANNYIWFNSVVKINGRKGGPATISFDASTISFTVNGNPVSVSVPAAIIIFDTSATSASTTFDTGSGTWVTIVPANYTGNVFLAGVSYQLPYDLPGGVKNVEWCGNFSSDTTGLSAQWQWGAAVYEYPCATSPTGYPGINVKPIDGPQLNCYNNGDHAGTPEYFGKSCVIGGARGGGGSNWTGSYSGTTSVTLCPGSSNGGGQS